MEDNNKKAWLNTHFASIVVGLFTTIGTVLGAWFVYNQYSKDKLTDYKIEQMRLFNEEKISTNNRQIAVVYGELYDLMHRLDVDRVFIIQPHPEMKHLYLSVLLEVDKKGVSMVKDIFQNIPMSEMASFAKTLATTCWLYYDDIDEQVIDKRTQSLMRLAGSTNIIIKQLVNASGSWIGSLVAENTAEKPLNENEAKELVKNTANTIQFILPPIN